MSPPALEVDRINAQQLVEEIRRELDPVEQELRHHPYLAALETGRVRREDLTRFAGEQHHIIQSDLHAALAPQQQGIGLSSSIGSTCLVATLLSWSPS